MNTPGHVLISLALVKNPKHKNLFWPVVIGAVLPDAGMFLFYVYQKIMGTPESVIWNEKYFQDNWQDFFDAFNSVPLILIFVLIAFWQKKLPLVALGLSMLVHCLLDFPLHNDDGHRHLWPFSDYRFESPISYWDPDHYGVYMMVLESFLALLAFAVCWKFYQSKIQKRTLILMIIPYFLLLIGLIVYQIIN